MVPHCISGVALPVVLLGALLGAAAAQDAPEAPAHRLREAQSPYLRSHATDPIAWWPWSEAAFALAKEQDKPVFLTIGYSACHWCHRMQQDTFLDAEVSKRLAEGFVCIAVDREERPDIDAHYQNALVIMSERGGGWPATLMLLPDGRPFWGGTYFPAEEGPWGPGLRDILDRIRELWATDRANVLAAASELHDVLAQDPLSRGSAESDVDFPAMIDGSATLMTGALDSTYGGVRGAPKFPPTLVLRFLLVQLQRTSLTVGDVLGVSLDAMSCGGLYDPIGGGFFRYCLDEQWQTPHFEKMLAENAVTAALYAEAAAVLGETRWREPALDTLAWARHELRLETGLYAAALDADSLPFDDAPEGDPSHAAGHPVPRAGAHPAEGRFYLWTPAQVERVLGDFDGPAFAQLHRITAAGNFSEPEGPTGLSLPTPMRTVPAMAAEPLVDIKPGAEFLSWRRHALERLRAARELRPRPARDDKAVAAGNGLLLSALARAGGLLDDAASRAEAVALAGALRRRLIVRDEALPRVVHQEFEGRTSGRGDLFDTTAVALGLLDAHELTGDPALLLDAFALARAVLAGFEDPEGGFFDADRRDPLLPGVGRNPWDGPVPAGSSLAVALLLRLAPLDDSGALELAARRAIARVGTLVVTGAPGFPALLTAMDAVRGPLVEVVLDGEGEPLAALQHALRGRPLPSALRLPDARALGAAIEAERAAARAAGRAPLFATTPTLLAERRAPAGEARAWVCLRRACQLPASRPDELAARLAAVMPRKAAEPAPDAPP